MPGFSIDPGGATLVTGRYIVKAVQSQMIYTEGGLEKTGVEKTFCVMVISPL